MTALPLLIGMFGVMMVSIISFLIGLAVGVWINVAATKVERRRPDLKVVK